MSTDAWGAWCLKATQTQLTFEVLRLLFAMRLVCPAKFSKAVFVTSGYEGEGLRTRRPRRRRVAVHRPSLHCRSRFDAALTGQLSRKT